jgi:tetratricopeptide (TPR) repeat protein
MNLDFGSPRESREPRPAGFDDPSAELRHWIHVVKTRPGPLQGEILDRIAELDGVLEVARVLALDDGVARGRATAALWELWHRAAGEAARRRLEIAEAWLTEGDYARCIAALDALLEEAPGFAEALNKRATARFLAGDFEGAVRDCEETLRRNPIHFGAWHGLGLTHLKLLHYRDALRAFEHAHAIQPFEPSNLRGVALCERVLSSGEWNA